MTEEEKDAEVAAALVGSISEIVAAGEGGRAQDSDPQVKPRESAGQEVAEFLQTTYNQNPENGGIRYDFASRQFIDADGATVTQERFNDLARTVANRTGRPGEASIRRAALLQSLVRSESSERPGILEDILRRGALHVSGEVAAHGPGGSGQNSPDLRGVFSRTEAPKRGFLFPPSKPHCGRFWIAGRWHQTL